MYLNSLVNISSRLSSSLNIQHCMKSLCFCASMHNGEMWQLAHHCHLVWHSSTKMFYSAKTKFRSTCMAEPKNYIPKWNRSLLYIIAISWLPPPKKRNRYITVYIIYMWLQNGRGTLHFQALGWKVQGEEGRNVWASLFIFHITCFTSLHLCYGPWASALPPELILSSCASWPRRASRWSSVGSSPFVKGWWRRLRALVRRVVGSWAAPERPLQRCYGVWTCTTPPPTCCCVDCTSQ